MGINQLLCARDLALRSTGNVIPAMCAIVASARTIRKIDGADRIWSNYMSARLGHGVGGHFVAS